MQDLLITSLDEAVIQTLNDRAAIHGTTPSEEAKKMLDSTLRVDRSKDPWAAVDAIREKLAASGRIFSDSAELLREDLDR